MNIHVGAEDLRRNGRDKRSFMMLQCGRTNMTPKSYCLRDFWSSETHNLLNLK